MICEDDLEEFSQLVSKELAKGEINGVKMLFRSNRDLYGIVGRLLKSPKINVRLGVTILMEDLYDEKLEETALAIPDILSLFSHESPVVRGDAANLIGIIGSEVYIADLAALQQDDNADLAEIVNEAIEEIQNRAT